MIGSSPLHNFPEELKWEALVDVLRGRVKVIWANLVDVSHSSTSQVNAHCYESVDLDDFVRVGEELNFETVVG